MSVTVELSYDMSKALGERRLEMPNPGRVREVVSYVEQKFVEKGADFSLLSKVTSVAINGVLTNHRRGMKTKLKDGDVVAYVKAASGG